MDLDAKILNNPNSITPQKDHIPRSSWFHSMNAGMVQYTKINNCNAAYKQNQGQKPHDHLNRRRKHL
jgi:hypothetical protein